MRFPFSRLLVLCTLIIEATAFAQLGSYDITFNVGAGLNDSVRLITPGTNGQIYVAGHFTRYNGFFRRFIVRLLADAAVDRTFDPGQGADGDIKSIAVQSDGRILLGGYFGTVNQIPRRGVCRLRADASLDLTFQATGDYRIEAVALEEGKYLIAGSLFSPADGYYHPVIARLDATGAPDTSFTPPPLANGAVLTVSLDPDGSILVGGTFTSTGATNRSYIARLQSNGSIDESFDAGLIFSTSGAAIQSLTVLPDRRILVTGIFSSIDGYSRQGIAILLPNGAVDNTFSVAGGFDSGSLSIAAANDGTFFVAGYFNGLGGVPQPYLAHVSHDGSVDGSFRPILNARCFAVYVQPDQRIIVGGDFWQVNATNSASLARLNGIVTPPAGMAMLQARAYAGVTLSGVVSNIYRIEFVRSLKQPLFWNPLTNILLTSPQILWIDAETPSYESRFYRSVLIP